MHKRLKLLTCIHHANCEHPYQSKSMGMIWKNLDHIWLISGNGMGRLSNDIEFIIMVPNFKVWEMCGKKRLCFPMYRGAMRRQYP